MSTQKVIVKASNYGFGASIFVEGKEIYFNQLEKNEYSDLGLAVISECFGRFYPDFHCQIAVDAGGSILESHTNKWDETTVEVVEIESQSLVNYCNQLQSQANPNTGKMLTSLGEWVLADDWDRVEESL